MDNSTSSMSIVGLIVGAILLVVVAVSAGSLVEGLDANEIMVIQDPIDGELHVYTEPGIYPQMFGKITKYPRRSIYQFDSSGDSAAPKKLRFNDGGHADLSGSVSWEMPLATDAVIKIHRTFGNTAGVETQAVAKMIDAAVYLSGPLMSSTESSGERRAELVQYIDDQAEKGVYVTRIVESRTVDPLTNETRTMLRTEIVKDDAGQPKRQQGSMLADFMILLMPMSIKSLDYDDIVEKQIKTRQDAITQVQIAQANARRAEQDAITVAKQGEAEAAKAKWEQEVIKAKAVTEAQQKFEVAKLAAQEAEQWKQEQILRGEGEGERKRLVMAANGALDQKLEAYVEIQRAYAKAISDYKGNWVPGVVMAGTSGNSNQSGNGAQALIDMLSAKTARDLNIDLTMQSNNK